MQKTAILLINLGSPKSTSPSDVKIYLDEFLMDQYVIDLPYLLRFLLVKGIILNVRPKKVQRPMPLFGGKRSSLIVISERFQKKFQNLTDLPVGLAMRYAEPSIQTGIQSLLDDHPDITKIVARSFIPTLRYGND